MLEVVALPSTWWFQIDQNDIGEQKHWFNPTYPHSQWGTIAVPGCWDNWNPALWGYEGIGWYAVDIPGAWIDSSQHQELRFHAVGNHARVWLNGDFLGECHSGYLPFSLPINGSAISRSINRLVIRVNNSPIPGELPASVGIEWPQYGGIIQPVEIVTKPPVSILSTQISTVLHDNAARVSISSRVINRSSEPFRGYVQFQIDAVEAVSSPLLIEPNGEGVASVEINLDSPRLWSPESPNLYQLDAALISQSTPTEHTLVERSSVTMGLRTICVRGRDILLNGEPIFIKGVCRYDEYAGYGRAVPEPLIRSDLELIKAAGANLVRYHYPPDPIALKIMDELGLFAIVEVPLNWWEARQEFASAEIDTAERWLAGMIERDRNHPSVIAWSMANESATDTPIGAAAMRRLLAKAREADPTRLAIFVINNNPIKHAEALAEADLVAINPYPCLFHSELAQDTNEIGQRVGPEIKAELLKVVDDFPDKPILVTEFGTHGVFGLHGGSRFTEEYQAQYLQEAWQAITSVPGVLGGVLWAWADYNHRRNFIGEGDVLMHTAFGAYGAVTVDRQPKLALSTLASMYGGTLNSASRADSA